MAVVDYIKRLLNAPNTLPIILALITYYIGPDKGIPDSLIILPTAGVFVVTLILISVIGQPAIEFKFRDEDNAVILARSSATTRANYLEFTVNVKNRFKYISKMFFIHDLNEIFLQLYWVPKKSLQPEIYNGYTTLSSKDGYPSICTFDLAPNQRYEYSLKISCTPQYHEATNVDIKVKLISSNSNNLRLKLFLFCIKIKAESKSVMIRNK